MSWQLEARAHIIVSFAKQLRVRRQTHRFEAIVAASTPNVLVYGL